MNWRSWAPLLVAALLLTAGAIKYPSDYSDAIVGAGLVTLGAWLATEVGDAIHRRTLPRKEEPNDERTPRG